MNFFESLKNDDTKYLLIFHDSYEQICNSTTFVEKATTGGRCGLRTIYIKHMLCHQSQLGPVVKLQITHIVSFKSPRDVPQVSTLSAQLHHMSMLFNWYWDATSVPCGHLMTDLSPRTNNRLRFWRNSGAFS